MLDNDVLDNVYVANNHYIIKRDTEIQDDLKYNKNVK